MRTTQNAPLAFGLCLIPSMVLALTLPNVPCTIDQNFVLDTKSHGCITTPVDLTHLFNSTENTTSPERVTAPATDFRPAEFRIFKTGKRLVYSSYGPEMPNFDDVIDMLEKAEKELETEIATAAGVWNPIAPTRTWTLGTAKLLVMNPEQSGDGLDARSLLQFLKGLWVSGTVYGFFEVDIGFVDDRRTVSERGRAVLERSFA